MDERMHAEPFLISFSVLTSFSGHCGKSLGFALQEQKRPKNTQRRSKGMVCSLKNYDDDDNGVELKQNCIMVKTRHPTTRNKPRRDLQTHRNPTYWTQQYWH